MECPFSLVYYCNTVLTTKKHFRKLHPYSRANFIPVLTQQLFRGPLNAIFGIKSPETVIATTQTEASYITLANTLLSSRPLKPTSFTSCQQTIFLSPFHYLLRWDTILEGKEILLLYNVCKPPLPHETTYSLIHTLIISYMQDIQKAIPKSTYLLRTSITGEK